ncbi:MAG: DUF2251 domain-containing protein [Ferruginibacter sp.]
MNLDLNETFRVGHHNLFESVSPTLSFGVTFEDDLSTGYFYAVNTKPDLQIIDALHIYNVADVIDKDKPSKLQIAWSVNGEIASLLINNYCHAIFDFGNKMGYSRNGFPESYGKWTKHQVRILTDDLVNEIFKTNK